MEEREKRRRRERRYIKHTCEDDSENRVYAESISGAMPRPVNKEAPLYATQTCVRMKCKRTKKRGVGECA
jgi:hypothetical protein